jgi:hypothetical protein
MLTDSLKDESIVHDFEPNFIDNNIAEWSSSKIISFYNYFDMIRNADPQSTPKDDPYYWCVWHTKFVPESTRETLISTLLECRKETQYSPNVLWLVDFIVKKMLPPKEEEYNINQFKLKELNVNALRRLQVHIHPDDYILTDEASLDRSRFSALYHIHSLIDYLLRHILENSPLNDIRNSNTVMFLLCLSQQKELCSIINGILKEMLGIEVE